MEMSQAGDTMTQMLHAIDSKEWDSVRRTFADTLEMDYSSLFGDRAIVIDADQQVAGWRAFAGAFDVTQHITGPVVVAPTAGGAIARTHVRAYHRIRGASGGDVWMVAGHYTVKLLHTAEGWKIAGITLSVFYQEGNLDIPQIARARASASRAPDA